MIPFTVCLRHKITDKWKSETFEYSQGIVNWNIFVWIETRIGQHAWFMYIWHIYTWMGDFIFLLSDIQLNAAFPLFFSHN